MSYEGERLNASIVAAAKKIAVAIESHASAIEALALAIGEHGAEHGGGRAIAHALLDVEDSRVRNQ